LYHEFILKHMAKIKKLDMSEVAQDKETEMQKLALFQNRVERKKAYIHAIDDAINEGKKFAEHADTPAFDRARTWVWIFEMQEKANAQRQLLSQHILYLKQFTDEQNL
jgi:hypothetical protein